MGRRCVFVDHLFNNVLLKGHVFAYAAGAPAWGAHWCGAVDTQKINRNYYFIIFYTSQSVSSGLRVRVVDTVVFR